MKPFTYNVMLLLQKVEEALVSERQLGRTDILHLNSLRRRKRLLTHRFRRSLAQPNVARG
jgi:hypothetical protein